LREYQGVDPHFDLIARQYHEIVKVIWLIFVAISFNICSMLSLLTLVELQKLEGMQWTIHQVEMDLKPHHDHAAV
jgi:HAUS augmin-like complex subunit 4